MPRNKLANSTLSLATFIFRLVEFSQLRTSLVPSPAAWCGCKINVYQDCRSSAKSRSSAFQTRQCPHMSAIFVVIPQHLNCNRNCHFTFFFEMRECLFAADHHELFGGNRIAHFRFRLRLPACASKVIRNSDIKPAVLEIKYTNGLFCLQ